MKAAHLFKHFHAAKAKTARECFVTRVHLTTKRYGVVSTISGHGYPQNVGMPIYMEHNF